MLVIKITIIFFNNLSIYFVCFQAKSGKELVGFLMNDFLLLAQPPKPVGNIFSFEKYANSLFKLYRKVRAAVLCYLLNSQK